MRILYLDIDTTRADHLGCYGYHKNTSPNIDRIAKDGLVFTNYYCSDAPCLPSRTALFTGQFGIRSGVVGHGQSASQLHIDPTRKFRSRLEFESLFGMLRNKGFYTVGITPFASRHSAWYFYGGFSEIYDTGKRGIEKAHEVVPTALSWLERNKDRDNWYLHVNLWDPHTPYRTPEDFPNPFSEDNGPDWITSDVLEQHKKSAGPHHAQEIMMFTDQVSKDYPRQVGRLDTLEDVKKLFDGYDIGIRYADTHIGKILDLLEKQGILEDTAVIISSDHGENMGELGIYAEHGTADQGTCHIPFIVKWPNGIKGQQVNGLHYNLDLISTLADLVGAKQSPEWDGVSFAKTIKDGSDCGRDYLVVSQMAHVCQRSVRARDYLYIRTYHDGYHFFPKHMLFNLKDDPHEQCNLALLHPEIVHEMTSLLFDWHDQAMKKNHYEFEDPMSTVLREGGPFHASMQLKNYVNHLIKTNRSEYIERYKELYPHEFKDRT
ncbi:MAG: sulfatase [Bacilli bacterium]